MLDHTLRSTRSITSLGNYASYAAMLFALALPAQTRAQPCVDDDGCEAGFTCERDDFVCFDRPGQEPDCGPSMVGDGECEPTPIACAVDSDCPRGLLCETTRRETSCSASPPGAGQDPPVECTGRTVEIEEPRCVYEFVLCTSDEECSDGLTCQAIGRESECSSSPSPNCQPGTPCEPPLEPICEDRTFNFCFPPRRDCTRDGDCNSGDRCMRLPEDALDDAPEGWEGATDVCMPEGLALLIEGRVRASRNSASSSSQDANEGVGRGASGTDAQASNDTEAAPATGAASSGCAAVAPYQQQHQRSAVNLLAGALALVVLARRRRVRR